MPLPIDPSARRLTGKLAAPRPRPGLRVDVRRDRPVCAADGRFLDLCRLPDPSEDLYYHGSHAASLLAFADEAGPDRGALLPMGRLRTLGRVPLSGESGNALLPNALNANAVSAVPAQSFTEAYDYATSSGCARRFDPAHERETLAADEARHACSEPGDIRDALAGCIAHAQSRLERHARLPAEQRALVDAAFPVVYGFTVPKSARVAAHSDIPGEIGVAGGVPPTTLRVVYVAGEHADRVRDIVAGSPATAHVVVRPLEELWVRSNAGDASSSHSDRSA